MLCIGLESCIFAGTIYDNSTLWNKNFNPEDYGAIMRGSEKWM